ncbi:MAG: FAD-dependent oxidoreductase [Acidobacteriota bacterium]
MSRAAILAVDDEPQVLRAVARDLRRRYGADYRIVRSTSASDALSVLQELQQRREPVALVLSDQRMPEMDGVSFLEEAAPQLGSAKRVLLTAYADTDAAIGAINRSQVDYYLLKPWDPPEEQLYPVLDDLLADWRAGFRPPFTGLRVVGDRWSVASHEVRDFLARNHVPYRFEDIEVDPEAAEFIEQRQAAESSRESDLALPLVVLQDGEILEGPSPSTLASAVGLATRANQPFYDLAIVGAGPAGLASAVYGGSEGLRTVLLERQAPGGQAGTSSRIENYLGFPSGLSGADLARRATAQARKFEVEVLTPVEVESLRLEGPYKHLTLSDGSQLSCHALMLSTGVSWRRLPWVDHLAGRGVYYGAALTEAAGCRDQDVYMVGAGNSAGQAALHFADSGAHVHMLVRGGNLGAKMSQYLVDRIEASPAITVHLRTEIREALGEERLEGLELTVKASTSALEGEQPAETTEQVETRYLFVFIGAAPRTDWLQGAVALDQRGFLLTGPDLGEEELQDWPLERPPYLLEASVPGIFVAGDVRHQSIKRVAAEVGEGSVAVHFIHRYLADL